ncbi:MAG: hypothetical protein WC913_10545 [Desulfuromonas sp.]
MLDAGAHHLANMAGTARPAMQIPLFGGATSLLSFRRTRNVACARGFSNFSTRSASDEDRGLFSASVVLHEIVDNGIGLVQDDVLFLIHKEWKLDLAANFPRSLFVICVLLVKDLEIGRNLLVQAFEYFFAERAAFF